MPLPKRISGCRIRRAPKEQRLYNGTYYDSKAEMLYARYLDLLVRAGEVDVWFRQVPFSLGCPENRYRADFVDVRAVDGHARFRAIEVKGADTKESRRWRRLWKQYGPCTLYIVRRCGDSFKVTDVIEGGRDTWRGPSATSNESSSSAAAAGDGT